MRMLGKSGQLHCHRGPLVGGLRVKARRTRRIARAREREVWRREAY